MRIRNTKELGEAIKQTRKELGYTQSDISQRTGLSESFISDIENGKETAEIGKVLLLINLLGLNVFIKER